MGAHSPQQDPLRTIAIIGAGAAGLFTAAQLALRGLGHRCILFEKTQKPAAKILISGGGRCNVTNACFDPKILVQNYPRGERELLGPFQRFGPKESFSWFQKQGIELKIEEDGRVFPSTNHSSTIANCLEQVAKQGGVIIRLGTGIEKIQPIDSGYEIQTQSETIQAKQVLLATGSQPTGHRLAQALGHTISPRVPSLFSFHIENFHIADHAGITVEVEVGLNLQVPKQQGTILITHTGFSGPAILKLSAWGARHLHDANYQATLIVDYIPGKRLETLWQEFKDLKKQQPTATLISSHIFPLPKKLLRSLLQEIDVSPQTTVGHLSDATLRKAIESLKCWSYRMIGQSTHKMEFVTCGGICLDEVNFKRFESKLCPGLFFAGEILDIDAVTGGFNFQNAWTGAWHVAETISQYYLKENV